jgi:biopolymer transport protein ExbD
MGRTKKNIHVNHNFEFELDLAPLLSVMVKLVPVLLLSSAFVQINIIETELPQVVKEAIAAPDKDPAKQSSLELDVSTKDGIKIILTDPQGSVEEFQVPVTTAGFDYHQLHLKLVEIKKAHPEIFKFHMRPDSNVSYKDLVKIMDAARRAKDPQISFPVFDKRANKEIQTPYMFPDVAFANMMEG